MRRFIYDLGRVWAYEYCSTAALVTKADDNVVLDLDSMVKVLKLKKDWNNVITCPTVSPRRFNKVKDHLCIKMMMMMMVMK